MYIKKFRCYISLLSTEAPIELIFTKVDMGAYLPDIIIYSQYQLRGFDSVRGRILPFPIGKPGHVQPVISPNHLNLPFLFTKLTGSNPHSLFNSQFFFLTFEVNPHIYVIVLIYFIFHFHRPSLAVIHQTTLQI